MNIRLGIMTAVVGAAIAVGMMMFTSPPASASTFDFVNCSTITSGSPNNLAFLPCPAAPFTIPTNDTQLTYMSTDGVLKGLSVTGWTGLPGVTIPSFIEIKDDTAVSGEVGLGLQKNPPDFEITTADLLNLDTSGVTGGGGKLVSATLTVQSIQIGEGFTECLGNTPGALGTFDCNTFKNPGTGGVTQPFSINVADLLLHPVIGLTATASPLLAADVLLNADVQTFATVPEPSSVALLGTGFLGLALMPFVRRRFGR